VDGVFLPIQIQNTNIAGQFPLNFTRHKLLTIQFINQGIFIE
jgi:hypothetical protein